MPLFDRSKLPPEFPEEIIAGTEAIVARLRVARVQKIEIRDPQLGLTIPNLVRCFLQAHLRRCLNFVEGGLAELQAGRPLVAELCTRSILESVATMHDFANKVVPLCDAGDYQSISDLTTNMAFATRIPSFLEAGNPKAPQILNQVDAMHARYPDYRENYDHLSDIVHPNGLGCVVYFMHNDGDGLARFFDNGTPGSAERAMASFFLAVVFLAYFEIALGQIEKSLATLTDEIRVTHELLKAFEEWQAAHAPK